MSSEALFEGHWRSLEQAFAEKLRTARARPLAVVTAGYPLMQRLLKVLSEAGYDTLCGIQFFPGIPRLASKLSPLPSSPPPSPATVACSGLAAYGSPERALSGAGFLAGLLEQGIGPEEFGVVLESLPEDPGPMPLETLKALKLFESSLSKACPRRDDTIMREGPRAGFEEVIMYGFYDLNPGQRRYIRALAGTTSMSWFSPVHPSSPWRGVYARTGDFLGKLFGNRRHRVDAGTPLSSMALLGESLLTRKVFQVPPGVATVSCGSGLGFRSGVVQAVTGMLSVRPDFKVAVAARGADRDSVVLALNLAGVGTSPGFSIPWASTPSGGFLLGVCSLPVWNWHHLEIQRLLASGIVFGESPSEYIEEVVRTGARFGLEALSMISMPFAGKLLEFGRALPEAAPPGVFLEALKRLAESPAGVPLPGTLAESAFDAMSWRSREPVTLGGFRVMLEAQLEGTSAEVYAKSSGGVQVLSPEQLRGTLFDGVVLTGLEEAVLPSRPSEDPRFPAALRQALEMSTGESREQEEAFILRQAFEAAGERLTLLVRSRDEQGRSQVPSPLVGALFEVEEKCLTVISDSAPALISPPVEAPFLDRVVMAERDRIFNNTFGIHDGNIGPGLVPPPDRITASLLEKYASCPFRYLVERIWKLPEQREAPVLSAPDKAANGLFTHRAVELAISGLDAGKAVEAALEQADLTAMLGSEAFALNYRNTLVESVESVLSYFGRNSFQPVACEVWVNGCIAGFPGTGRIDMLVNTPEGLTFLDLKTGNPANTQNPLSRNNLFQLPVYYALSDEKPVRIGYLHLVRGGDPVLNSATGQEMREALPGIEMRVKEIVRAINEGFFPPGGDPRVCAYCSHGGLCRLSPRIRLEGKLTSESSSAP